MWFQSSQNSLRDKEGWHVFKLGFAIPVAFCRIWRDAFVIFAGDMRSLQLFWIPVTSPTFIKDYSICTDQSLFSKEYPSPVYFHWQWSYLIYANKHTTNCDNNTNLLILIMCPSSTFLDCIDMKASLVHMDNPKTFTFTLKNKSFRIAFYFYVTTINLKAWRNTKWLMIILCIDIFEESPLKIKLNITPQIRCNHIPDWFRREVTLQVESL